MDITRQTKYEKRDDCYAYNPSNKIYEHDFCLKCRSKECSDKSHPHIELHPIIRIPKKNAHKSKWRTFFELVANFGIYNMRHKRH